MRIERLSSMCMRCGEPVGAVLVDLECLSCRAADADARGEVNLLAGRMRSEQRAAGGMR